MIWMEGITKTYQLGEITVPVLKGINLSIEEGEYVAIMGASGSGKSTLMNIIGCLDRATSGHYVFEGSDLTTFNDDELAYVRNQRIGFVFQQFNLLPRATALENVMVPMVYANVPKSVRLERAKQALMRVGLGERMNNRPSQLSGGQQQRVAIARALITRPSLLICDEPVSMLDASVQAQVLDLMLELKEEFKLTYLFITHDLWLARFLCDRIAVMNSGQIVEIGPTQELFTNPQHHYTKTLLQAAPLLATQST
ncbi:MAG TPA: macrolide ABC transporter ATP-binding protein [Cyanobacteria bacterium UBA8553]|nr:macrolide ABC transporter ATP-binding protein [Cyanobacteria bacterium UBA8553]